LFALLLVTLSLSIAACAKRSRNVAQSLAAPAPVSSTQPQRININTASANELEALPGIGKGLAQRIIEHREKYGPFRKPEYLIIVRGISDKRFQALRELIKVD
jgi:competence protein ComEA